MEKLELNASACFETNGASRYLAALCQHFGRRVEADCDDKKGWVQFPFGRCEFKADSQRLELFASAESQVRLDQVIQVVTNHLDRYAFRESPNLVWQPVSQPKSR